MSNGLRKADLYLLALIAGELIVYSIGFQGYFYGDSVAVLYLRPKSLLEAIASLTDVQIFGFCRPLSQSLIPLLLYPIFRTHFAPYHAFNLLLHVLISSLVYLGLARILQNRLAAFIGALFFGIHAIGFYTSYDIAFLADTGYTLFYLLALWAFLKGRHLLALGLFVLTLSSKEAGITLPILLAALIVTVPQMRASWRSYVRPLLPFVVVLAVYLGLYTRYFLIGRSEVTSWTRSDYVLFFNRSLLGNTLRYLHWVFQIPDGWVTGNWLFAAPYSYVVYAFALSILAFAVIAAIRGNLHARIGLLGFFITALPMLPLNRYLPHHPYLPLAGFALLVAAFFAFLQRKLPHIVFLALAAVFCLNHVWLAHQDGHRDLYNSWVGANAVICRTTAEFTKTHPLNNSSVVYLVADKRDDSLDFAFHDDMLIRFITSLDKIRTLIVTSDAHLPRPLPANTFVARLRYNRVFDVTDDFSAPPASGASGPPLEGITIDKTGLLSWNTKKEVEVFVSKDGAPDILLAHFTQGKTRPEWLAPEHTFRFTMREFRPGPAGPVLDWASYRQEDSGAVSIMKAGQAQKDAPRSIPWVAIGLGLVLMTVFVDGWRRFPSESVSSTQRRGGR